MLGPLFSLRVLKHEASIFPRTVVGPKYLLAFLDVRAVQAQYNSMRLKYYQLWKMQKEQMLQILVG